VSEPEWLDVDIVLDVHAEQLSLFGGSEGVREIGLLESALARPANKFAYGDTKLSSLAAAYGFGIARNHPFIDGNKRAAFSSIIVFLGLNGIDFKVPQEQATAVMMDLGAGEVDEEALTKWIEDNLPKRRLRYK
jgi:death-on-curing protein